MSFLSIPSSAGALLGCALLSSLASAQFAVNPNHANVGTVITLTAGKGTTFGEKVKVFASQAEDEKINVLKVRSASANQIEVEVKKLDKTKLGQFFDLTVQVKGSDTPITLANAVLLGDLDLDGPFPVGTPAGIGTLLSGENLPARPAKVKIGGKPAKVTEWTANSLVEGVSTDPNPGFFFVQPHKSLPNGTYDLEIKTNSSIQVFPGGVTVTGSTAGLPKKTGISGNFGPDKFKSAEGDGEDAAILAEQIPGVQSFLSGGGHVGAKKIYVLALFIEWAPGDGDAIFTEDDVVSTPVEWSVTTLKKVPGSVIPQVVVDQYEFVDFNMSLSEVGERAAGTFSGTMERTGGTGDGPEQITVTNGEFNLAIAAVDR